MCDLGFPFGYFRNKDTRSSEKYFAHLECGERVNDVNYERVKESLSDLSFYNGYEVRIFLGSGDDAHLFPHYL